jgi:sulfur-oxidizing protein SoxY
MSLRFLLSRRSFFRTSVVAAAAVAGEHVLRAPRELLARVGSSRPGDDEPTEAVKRVLKEHFGDRPIRKGHVELTMPEDAPDGRFVPVFVESDLPMQPDDYVEALHLLVDKNPDIHLAEYQFTPALGKASIDTRIKMRATSWVRAIAETSRGELWYASFKVFPQSNGCG